LASSDLLDKAGLEAKNMPKGYVGLSGIYDVPLLVERNPKYEGWFIDMAFGAKPNWKTYSPQDLPIKHSAPWLVVHSADDELVPERQSKQYVDHLKSQKVAVKLLEIHGKTHDQTCAQLGESDGEVVGAVMKMISPGG
jgi:acetyl esterase/lipase